MMIADDLGLRSEVFTALCEYTAIASVGPIMTATFRGCLTASGLPGPLHFGQVRRFREIAADNKGDWSGRGDLNARLPAPKPSERTRHGTV